MPTLREVFTPLIAYTLFLTRTPAEYSRPFIEIRHDFDRLLEQQRAAVKRNDIAPQDYENGCFAIIAWVDEAVTRCGHDFNPELLAEWRRAPLQTVLFNTANAGEEFFERLADLSPAQKQVIELYHLALCLGFRGRYYDENQNAQLIELRRQYGAHLTASLLEPLEFEQRQEHLTPQPYAVPVPQPKLPRRRPSPYWLAAPALALTALVLFLLWPSGPNRQALEDAVRGFDCASINVGAIDKGQVSLSGHVARDEQRDEVRHKILAVPRVKAVNDDLTVIPWPFCEVMDILAPLKNESSEGGFALDINPSKGCDGVYYRGEHLELDVTAKKPLHYVYIDYFDAGHENVVHLVPNPIEKDNALNNSHSLTIGATGARVPLTIKPPFGHEMVTVISSPEPLFSSLRDDPEPASDYLAALKEALKGDMASHDRAANYCFTISEDR
jgi:type IV/VI secretion system ImpK/VasF family protein